MSIYAEIIPAIAGHAYDVKIKMDGESVCHVMLNHIL